MAAPQGSIFKKGQNVTHVGEQGSKETNTTDGAPRAEHEDVLGGTGADVCAAAREGWSRLPLPLSRTFLYYLLT